MEVLLPCNVLVAAPDVTMMKKVIDPTTILFFQDMDDEWNNYPPGYYLMVMGGYGRYLAGPDHYLDEVELVSIDPVLYPVPDCLSQLNPLPEPHGGAAGALDYSRKSG